MVWRWRDRAGRQWRIEPSCPKVTELWLATRPEQFPPAIAASPKAVQKLPNICSSIVEQLPQEPIFGNKSTNVGQCWLLLV